MTHITILKDNDIMLFNSPIRFSEEDRIQFFTLPTDSDSMEFKQIHTKIGYILQRGYFLSQQKFFLPGQFLDEDIEYVTKLCGVTRYIDIKKLYNKSAYSRWKRFILKKYGYCPFSSYRDLLENEARELVKSSSKPKEIFYALVDYLIERKVEIPRYFIFAEVITKSLNIFESDLIKIIDKALTPEQKSMLDGFMNLPVDNSLELSAKNPYLITYLKKLNNQLLPER